MTEQEALLRCQARLAKTEKERDWCLEQATHNWNDAVRARRELSDAVSAARTRTIEECAKIADMHAKQCVSMNEGEKARTAATIADMVRAVAKARR